MSAFIFGTAYIDSPQRAELVQMWIELNLHRNPEFPLVLIDSASDPMWRAMVPQSSDVQIHTVADGDPLPRLTPGLNWIDFPENLGHLSMHGVDGWGRAFCRGVELGLQHNYDYVINIETDLLFRPHIAQILQDVQIKDIEFLSGWERGHRFIENCICFMKTDYLRRTDFIGRYDWHAQKPGYPWPEQRMEMLTSDVLLVKPWQGLRDDFSQCASEHIPYLDYITHAHEPELYYQFLLPLMPPGWLPPSQRVGT